MVYYNEIDPFAAAWLRELIKAGLIAPGEVDNRSIEDVLPSELAGFSQCHFFAGIGVWSYALRQAGWPDDRPIWTGSCPCQPFSAAGKGKGFADERHLWPAFHWLITQCRPGVVIGEQVASKDGLAWFDLVQSDMDETSYACWAVDTCAAGYGAPHIRQRLYWVAYAEQFGRRRRCASDDSRQAREIQTEGHGTSSGMAHTRYGEHKRWNALGDTDCPDAGTTATRQRTRSERQRSVDDIADGGASGGLAHTMPEGLQGGESRGENTQRETVNGFPGCGSATGGLADAAGVRRLERRSPEAVALQGQCPERTGEHPQSEYAGQLQGRFEGLCGAYRPGPTNGFWRNADWLWCRDGKWRPVEPGTFPLAHGTSARVGRLRGYGNAICAPQAQAFIEAVMEIL